MKKLRVWMQLKTHPEEQAVIESCWPDEAEVIYVPGRDPSAAESFLADTDVFVGYATEELVEAAPNLKLVHVLGHGVDRLVTGELRRMLMGRNIAVAKASASSIAIAEYVFTCMLALTRRVFKFHERLAYQGDRNNSLRAERMRGGIGGELFESSLGLIGFGNIGQEIAVRAHAFGMSIGALTRHPERLDCERYHLAYTATPGEIDAFLGKCDYVVLCLPGTDEAQGLIDRGRFEAMKDGSYLINVARGSHIVEEALWEALRSGKLAGAALDVTQEERSEKYGGYPFPFPIHHYNVILTPHYAGSTREARIRALRNVGENLRRLAHGLPLVNLADFDAGY